METIDETLAAEVQHQDLEQSFDSNIPDWDDNALAQFQVIRRNGQLTGFDANKISAALMKAFLAVEHSQTPSTRIKQITRQLTKQAIVGISRRLRETNKVHIEEIQDQVELALMRASEHKVARAYVLYREQHAAKRALQEEKTVVSMVDDEGASQPLSEQRLHQVIIEACDDLSGVDSDVIIHDSLKNLFDGITERDLNNVLIMTVRALIEKEPNYTYVASRLLLDRLRTEAMTHINHNLHHLTAKQMAEFYPEYFKKYLACGIQHELLSPELMRFDIARLGQALHPKRDLNFTYLGLQTLYDRYFLHWQNTRFELPQAFFMRVAMGLAINEDDREARAIEFYKLLSCFDLMSSTPTLFNSGTLRPQLSSCFISTIPDDLEGIFSAIKDNAMMQKWAGGIGNDWTPVRGMGSVIRGTNGRSQGVVPFMKVANDTLVSVNQCFAPETLIHTANGIKPIQSIKKGDLVLGQRGQYREVKEHLTYLQKQGAMVEIDVKHSINPIQVTTGHPFWVIKNVAIGSTTQKTLDKLEQGILQARWIEAGQLTKGDYVAQVIPEEVIPVDGFTEQDARLYGIMLGDGHCTQRQENWGLQFKWRVSGNPNTDAPLQFVRDYLNARGIHFWEKNSGENSLQIGWAYSLGVARDATTGQFVSGEPSLNIGYHDLYNEQGEKSIASRFAHLPPQHTLALVQGLIETDGSISREKEIYFTTTSQDLAEGIRYQCLRLGIPTAGQFNRITKVYNIRVPAVAKLAERVNCQALTKFNWIHYKNWLFTQIRSIKDITPTPIVHDLKVEGDESYMTVSALAHNGGKRRGSGCAYLEVWHIDIDEFLELRKNTGDERRRTHDMNTAAWISDLFMQRVHDADSWSLFSPDETPDLHDLYGKPFNERYEYYEALGQQGKLNIYKQVSAVELWRKILTMLFETGHPWLCYKEPCNIRSPQQHVGVVHSSNLCTEITLNTKAYADSVKNISEGEIAVCFPAGTQILTREGQKSIEQCDGQEILVPFSEDLTAQHRWLKTKLLPQGKKQVYELKVKNGMSIEATEEHPFLVQDSMDHDKPPTYRWKKLKDLKMGDAIVCPLTDAIYNDTGEQDEEFTAAGWMLGDGWFSQVNGYGASFTSSEKMAQHSVIPILNRWHQESELGMNATYSDIPTPYTQPNGKVNWHSKRQSFISYLQQRFGFAPMKNAEKYISMQIKTAQPNQIGSFLSGLFSANGCVMRDKRRKRSSVLVALSSASEQLLCEVQLLLKPFGIHGRLRGGQVTGRGEHWQGKLEIRDKRSILNFEQFIGFSLSPEKQARLSEYKLQLPDKSAFQHAAIVSIMPTQIKEVFDLSLEEDHSFIANGLVVHNCNLASINLPAHIEDDKLNEAKLQRTVTTAMRMLDNVVDINYYSVPQAKNANLKHRPVGLGIMGFQDSLYKMRIPYSTREAVEFADKTMELISYYAISASSDLAKERGKYASFDGSLWSQGILPIDSIQRLKAERGNNLELNTNARLDWDSLREKVKKQGMRNSNTMAIAPTATISSICGVSQSIEPMYQNLFVKTNLSGGFTIINQYLVQDLKALGLWDDVMINDLKYYDGSVQNIERIPQHIKALYATAFEIASHWLIECAARRQKWIDQSQSLNLYMKETSGRKLDALYKLAWIRGLKTTYYLRTMGATRVQKTTVTPSTQDMKACLITDPECESCQ